MPIKRLFIFVEGEDDLRFFNYAKDLIFKDEYDLREVRTYAKKKYKQVNNFLKSIKAMDADYVFVSDINAEPCMTAKKNSLLNEYKQVDKESIIIVVKEIESWYLAGLNDKKARTLGLKSFNTTDHITKEMFNDLIPKKFDSKIDFMIEVLNGFSLNVSKRKNKSLEYFIEKYS